MVQYHHLQPYFCPSLPQLDLEGRIPLTCNLGGPYQSPQTTSHTPKSTVFLCCQIHGYYEALLAQYHHLQPYSCHSLPQLDLRLQVGRRNRVVGGDTGLRVPHTCHVLGGKKKLLIWAYCWLLGGSDGVPLGCR